ncbi:MULTISPECIES: hypothetical protein [Kocuria]|uniref:Uncharacterized protein n=1 Tax=Kocuria subflava TaxID=1736139 RepID=A0A846TZF0_9MICC|nr:MULTISPECIES: hypothetical protein [Kocuria]NKE10587.1 hypothetical protein [Kocuria subflava]
MTFQNTTAAAQTARPDTFATTGRRRAGRRLTQCVAAAAIAVAALAPAPAMAFTSNAPATQVPLSVTQPTTQVGSPNLGAGQIPVTTAKNFGRCGGWYFWC